MTSNKTLNKILAVTIALLLWGYVNIEENPFSDKVYYDIPVQILNEEDLTERGLAIAGDKNFTVEVTVNARNSNLRELTKESIAASINVYGYSKIGDEQHLTVEIGELTNATIVSVRPEVISLTIEDLVSESKKVNVSVSGLDNRVMEEGETPVQPANIEVTGAKSQVDAITHIQVSVDASRLSDEEERTVREEGKPVDSSGREVENVTLSTRYVSVTTKLYAVKEVKVNGDVTGELPEGRELESLDWSPTVRIKGPSSVINSIAEVVCTLDLSEINTNARIPVAPDLPPNVSLASGSSVVAEIRLINIETKEFVFSSTEIQPEGLSDEYIPYIGTREISVMVTGSEAVIGQLEKSDLRLSIDLSEADPETTSVPIKIECNKDINAAVAEPEEIEITVSEAPSV